jgi:hypothetical protein
MVEHLVLYNLKPEVRTEERQKIIEKYKALKGVVPGLLEVSLGENISVETQFRHNYSLGMRMVFDTHEHSVDYLEYPAHKKVAELVFASIQDAAVCDFEISGSKKNDK